MRGILIFLIMLIGLGLVFRTTLDLQKNKRFMFKNVTIMKRQKVSFIIGVIGALILLITLLIIVY